MSAPSSPTQTATPRKPRRWLRFSLRLLLIGMTVLCVGLGWWTHRAREQRRLVERIQAGGGIVEYDFPVDPRTYEPLESSVPKWLLDRLGVDYFHNVIEVATTDPAVLPELPRLRRLERLVLGGNQLNDDDFRHIAKLTTLKLLLVSFSYTDTETPLPPLGDGSLAVVARLPCLESAWIKGSRITPEGIERLSRSESLRRVNVACADPSVDVEVAVPFREAGRVSYFCVERITSGVTVQTIVEWDTLGDRGIAGPR